MLFSSTEFLLFFFPLFFLVYFAASRLFHEKMWVKNAVLLVFSLFFYAWGELTYLWLIGISIVSNYALALLIGLYRKTEERAASKAILVLDVALNLCLLGLFKYSGFIVSTINSAFNASFDVPDIALPLGISFYTFQIMSYVVDVYRGDVEAQRNPFTVAVYLCAFPQLIAGPIVRYSDIRDKLLYRRESVEQIYDGLLRFVRGLTKKVLIANTCAGVCDPLFENSPESLGALGTWVGMLAYTLQIYYDFSGYSDMAIGMGKMMGFEYKENFEHPYAAVSVTDFWRRWHISLSSFFREYVYIPLGGNRVKKQRWVFNLLFVWLLTGAWHGAGFNFILWGLYYGILLLCEKTLWGRYTEKIPVVNHLLTLFFVIMGRVLFRFESLSEAVGVAAAMFAACLVIVETGAYDPFIYFRF